MARLEAALRDLSSETKELAAALNTLYDLDLLQTPEPVKFVLIEDTSYGQSPVLATLLGLRHPSKEASMSWMVTEYMLRPAVCSSEKEFGLVSEESSSTSRLDGTPSARMAPSVGGRNHPPPASHRTFCLQAENIVGMTFVYFPRRVQGEVIEECSHKFMSSIMSKPNTVLLPILSAQQLGENSAAIRTAKKFDPKSERTLGIITRLELIPVADHTHYFSFMAQDSEKRTLGWHVLYNNPFSRCDDHDTDRESDEQLYFKNKFSSSHVLPKDRGIAALRNKLSKIALDHLREVFLPSIITRIERIMSKKHLRLLQLGEKRSSVDEMRKFLLNIADQIHNLTAASIRGEYGGNFYKLLPLLDHSKFNGLRSSVRDLNDVFIHIMSTNGARWRFLSSLTPDGKPCEEKPLPAHLWTLLGLYSVPSPCVLLLDKFILKASKRQKKRQLSDHALAVDLFREQISRWEVVGRTHLLAVFDLAKNFTKSLLGHVVGEESSVYGKLLVDFVNPF